MPYILPLFSSKAVHIHQPTSTTMTVHSHSVETSRASPEGTILNAYSTCRCWFKFNKDRNSSFQILAQNAPDLLDLESRTQGCGNKLVQQSWSVIPWATINIKCAISSVTVIIVLTAKDKRTILLKLIAPLHCGFGSSEL